MKTRRRGIVEGARGERRCDMTSISSLMMELVGWLEISEGVCMCEMDVQRGRCWISSSERVVQPSSSENGWSQRFKNGGDDITGAVMIFT